MSEVKHESDNVVIKLDAQFSLGFFMTMNPGYVGRAKLPDSIKSYLEETVMSIPDLAPIVTIMLASSGFLECKELGEVVRNIMVQCKEKLTKTNWYDWGLRKLKQIC